MIRVLEVYFYLKPHLFLYSAFSNSNYNFLFSVQHSYVLLEGKRTVFSFITKFESLETSTIWIHFMIEFSECAKRLHVNDIYGAFYF